MPVQPSSHSQPAKHRHLVRFCWSSFALWPMGFWFPVSAAWVTSEVFLGHFYNTRQLHMHHLAPCGLLWTKKLGDIYFFFFRMVVRIRCEPFPCVWAYCMCECAFIYTCIWRVFDVFWECFILVFFCVLRLADGGAPEQMWHLNGLLFGKQVAECDRS